MAVGGGWPGSPRAAPASTLSFTQRLHSYDEVDITHRVQVLLRCMSCCNKHLLLCHLTLQWLHSRRDGTFKLGTTLLSVCIEHGNVVGVLGSHTVRSYVLHMGDQKVTVVSATNIGSMNVLDDQTEHVSVPLVDERP